MGAGKKLLFIAVAIVLLLGLNHVFEHGLGDFRVNPYYARIVNLVGISITLAVSLNLINGLAGQFSLGHAGFMAVGGYTATYVTVYHGTQIAGLVGSSLTSGLGSSVTMLASLVAGAVTAAIAGFLVGIPSLRLRGDYLAIVTLGFGEIIRVVILNMPSVGGATGFTNPTPITNFFWIFAMAALTIVIVRNIAASSFGRALSAIREDEIAAEAMGIDSTRYKVLAFVISSALAGVAGGLSGQLFANPLNPQNLNFMKSIEVVVMIVLGGIGSITGAVLGATTITILPEALRGLDQQFPGMRMVLYALILILLMIFRPQGLLGRRELTLSWLRRPKRAGPAAAPARASGARPAEPTPGPTLLRTVDVMKRFGGLTAVRGLTMELRSGELHGMIGPNGAGKTTVFNLLTGVYAATEGEIVFGGARIDGKKPYQITELGIARTFQNIRLFSDMTVLENVMTACHLRNHQVLADAVLGTRRHHLEEAATRARAMELLEIFDLGSVADEKSTSLPYGKQRRLEIARALATEPKLLLLDEPAAGMNPQEAGDLMRLIRYLRDERKLTILLVEHNMKVVMGICETIHVLDYGEVIALGTPEQVQRDPKVIEAYLGGG